jgi:hypothetical protein
MEFSDSELADRLVLGAIAHRVSNDNGEAFPSIGTIARESRLSERSVHYSIKHLQEMGELEVDPQSSPLGTNTYRFPKFLRWVQSLHPGGAKSEAKGVHQKAKGVQAVAPEPSLEPSVKQPSVESAAPDECAICGKLMQFCPVQGRHSASAIRKSQAGKRHFPSKGGYQKKEYVHVEAEPARSPAERRREGEAEARKVLGHPELLPEDIRRIITAK